MEGRMGSIEGYMEGGMGWMEEWNGRRDVVDGGIEWKEAWNGWTDVMVGGVEWKEGWDRMKERLNRKRNGMEGRMEEGRGMKVVYRRD